jgi:hypothetical protein
MWAAAAKMGFRWHVGNGEKIHIWEDRRCGSCSLAIQYWGLCSIVNEQGKTLSEAWDGQTLKISFRRKVGERMMNQWYEVVQIASSIQFSEEPDTVIW